MVHSYEESRTTRIQRYGCDRHDLVQLNFNIAIDTRGACDRNHVFELTCDVSHLQDEGQLAEGGVRGVPELRSLHFPNRAIQGHWYRELMGNR